VVLEIALTAVLLVTGGLLTRSLSRLLAVDPGFASENLATVHVSLPEVRYDTQEARAAFVVEVLQQLEGIPGVVAVTAGNNLPFPGTTSGWGVRDEATDPSLPRLSGKLFHVAQGYHEMMGIPPDAPAVTVVSEGLARGVREPKKREYVLAFAECGSRSMAAEVAEIGSTTPYSVQWSDDLALQAALQGAEEAAADKIEREAYRRGRCTGSRSPPAGIRASLGAWCGTKAPLDPQGLAQQGVPHPTAPIIHPPPHGRPWREALAAPRAGGIGRPGATAPGTVHGAGSGLNQRQHILSLWRIGRRTR
jgi:hypothetical protein